MPISKLLSRARALRRDQTEVEAKLWACLRDRQIGGFKWKRQVPVGPFVADFACAEARLIVELDGGQHSLDPEKDARRTHYLEGEGYAVIRFWNYEVNDDLDAVCTNILAECQRRRRDALAQVSGGIGFRPPSSSA